MIRCFVSLLLILFADAGWAQNENQPEHPPIPTITFDHFWEDATPQEYIISVKSDGTSVYLSRNPLKPVQPGEEKEPAYERAFTMSPWTSNKIFKLAQQANYFNGDFDYKAHPIANTGEKTLTYADISRHFDTTFNYSENKAIEELSHLFQSISSTIEHGRKLQFKYKYDKLGLESELKIAEDAAERHDLAEIQVIAVTLRTIADDPSVLNIARQRARRLLAKTGK